MVGWLADSAVQGGLGPVQQSDWQQLGQRELTPHQSEVVRVVLEFAMQFTSVVQWCCKVTVSDVLVTVAEFVQQASSAD